VTPPKGKEGNEGTERAEDACVRTESRNCAETSGKVDEKVSSGPLQSKALRLEQPAFYMFDADVGTGTTRSLVAANILRNYVSGGLRLEVD
jgi:hypothetical protein